MKNTLLSIFALILACPSFSQTNNFTRQDSLRGSITPERAWWDLNYYHLDIAVNPDTKIIEGKNTVSYKVLTAGNTLQIDLQPPMQMKKAMQDGKALEIQHDGNAHFIKLRKKQVPGKNYRVEVYYGGNPKEAVNPPWDGGITWEKDKKGLPFIASTCQGLGASVWWPCKDHMYDEPDSMLISVNVPGHLTNVSNGRLRNIEEKNNNTKTYHWFVSNPINNYGVNINIGDYVSFSEVYDGANGKLDLQYYVLRDNLEKAKKQFTQAPKTIEAFEHWFGPYPFYEDSYKLVEAPYLGMEHQSSVTYGNGYKNGYRGGDLSGTGWGLKFDFIIIHESGHEWFANSITNIDIADMWVHESFTNYSESLYLEYYHGKKAGAEYVRGLRKNVNHDKPIIGAYHVNHEGSSDMYFKGSNMLHTLRQIFNNDEKWLTTLRGLNKKFYHQTVNTEQIEAYLSKQAGRELQPFFDQYLRDTRLPTLEYAVKDGTLTYRWMNTVEGFNIPIRLWVDEKPLWIEPTTEWGQTEISPVDKNIVVDPDFYIVPYKL